MDTRSAEILILIKEGDKLIEGASSKIKEWGDIRTKVIKTNMELRNELSMIKKNGE